jgi:hypothetical protein
MEYVARELEYVAREQELMGVRKPARRLSIKLYNISSPS